MEREHITLTLKELTHLFYDKVAQRRFLIAEATSMAESIAGLYGYDIDKLRTMPRTADISLVRMVVCWYLRKFCGIPYEVIGLTLRRHHASAIYAERKIDGWIEVGDTKTLEAIKLLKENMLNTK